MNNNPKQPRRESPSLDIVLPVLNEESRLRRGVEETLEFCARNRINVRVTVADNGSTDATTDISAELQRRHENVGLVVLGTRGVGRVLKKAWRASRADVVGYMDVDLATDLRHLPEALELFRRNEGDLVVTGSRLLKGAEVVNRSLRREVISRAYNVLLQAALGIKFSDAMCGFKFLRKSTFDKLMDFGIGNDEWFFNTEILIKAEWLGIKTLEIPVHWTDDRDSRVRIMETSWKYIQEILRVREERKRRGGDGR